MLCTVLSCHIGHGMTRTNQKCNKHLQSMSHVTWMNLNAFTFEALRIKTECLAVQFRVQLLHCGKLSLRHCHLARTNLQFPDFNRVHEKYHVACVQQILQHVFLNFWTFVWSATRYFTLIIFPWPLVKKKPFAKFLAYGPVIFQLFF